MKKEITFLILTAIAIIIAFRHCIKTDQDLMEKAKLRNRCVFQCHPSKSYIDFVTKTCVCGGK